MRWSFWPVSITTHIVVGIAVFVVPLLAEVQPPTPAPIHPAFAPIKTVPVPESVASAVPESRRAPVPPSVVAPTTLDLSHEPATTLRGPEIPDLPPGTGSVDPSMLGTTIGNGPVLPEDPPPAPKPVQSLFKVGQGVREPKRISGLPPEYPVIARNAHVQGVVMLEAVINERGEVGRIKVLKSAPLLDQAAITAVQQWRYTPTLLNGVPVSVLMTITINFTLQN
jgi:periplasmic protein TonB